MKKVREDSGMEEGIPTLGEDSCASHGEASGNASCLRTFKFYLLES